MDTRSKKEIAIEENIMKEKVKSMNHMKWEFREIKGEICLGEQDNVFDPAAYLDKLDEDHPQFRKDGATVIDMGTKLVARACVKRFQEKKITSANVYQFKEDPLTGVFQTEAHITANFVGKSLNDVIPETPSYGGGQDWCKSLVVSFLHDLLKMPKLLYKLNVEDPLWVGSTCRFLLNLLLDPLCFFSLLEGDISGVSSNWTYVSQALTVACMHCEDNNVASLNLLVWGAPKLWFILDKKNTNELRKKLSQLYGGPKECIGIMNTKEFFIPPWVLQEWGIEFKVIVQRPGMLVWTFEGCAHQVLNLGYSINDSVNLMTSQGTRTVLNVEKYQCSCHKHLTGSALTNFQELKSKKPSHLVHGQDVLSRFHFNWFTSLPSFLRRRDPILRDLPNGVISMTDPRWHSLTNRVGYLCLIQRSMADYAKEFPDSILPGITEGDFFCFSDQLRLENKQLRIERDDFKEKYESLLATITPNLVLDPVGPSMATASCSSATVIRDLSFASSTPTTDEPYAYAPTPKAMGPSSHLFSSTRTASSDTSKSTKKYACHSCPKFFAHRSSLSAHEKIHDIGLFKCEKFTMSYGQASGLYRHVRKTHGTSSTH